MKTIPYPWRLIAATLLLSGSQYAAAGEFLRGADVSFIPELEKQGIVFRENGQPKDPLILLKEHGLNTIRLRIWHTPKEGHCGKESTLAMAKRVHEAGLKLLIDFHYSDYWADPSKQFKPAAWEKLTFPELEQTVRQYTREIISDLISQGTPPDMVQVGNEIANGMLWPDGDVGKHDDDLHWDQFTRLLKAGLNGIQDANGSRAPIQTMIHIDCGHDNPKSRWFFDHLKTHQVSFDLIGLSYYCWWHQSMDGMARNLNDLAERYGKPVIVAETAHPWRLKSNPEHPPKHGEIQAHPGYAATVEGQRQYLTDLIATVAKSPRGQGVCYWAPEWIPSPHSGGHWWPLTLFDDKGNALPSLDAFKPVSK